MLYFQIMDFPDPPTEPSMVHASLADVVARSHARGAKWSSLVIALLVHVGLLALLAFIVVQATTEPPPEFVVAAAEADQQPEMETKVYAMKNQPKPAAPSRAANVIASVTAANISVPTTDLVLENPGLGIGTGFGDGFGDGLGDGLGGGVAFFGNASNAKRVAFIIDVSRSLSDTQFGMIKKELKKSLNKLSGATQYQVLFFSGPAWFAEDVYNEKGRAVVSGGKDYPWKTRSIHDFYPTVGEEKLYTAKWKPANPANLKKSEKNIDDVERSLGTDWRWPLKLALKLKPKPDVVYFLTDGAVTGGDKMVEEILQFNRRGAGAAAVINTISMMQPKAAADLLEMAKKTRGTFTIVNPDGSTEQVKR
jgi:hypothetical protein